MMQTTQWFLNVDTIARPDKSPARSMTITKVASGSPAAALDLAPGDLFVSIDGTAALDAVLPDMLIGADTATYVFIRQSDSTQITVKTPALPMGIRTQATPDDVVQSYQTKPLHDFEGIQQLWDNEDYTRIRQICKKATSKGVMGKIGLSKVKNPLAEVLVAVCDLEEGSGTAPIDTIIAFDKTHGDRVRSDIAAVISFYVARHHQLAGNQSKYEHLMRWVMESPYNHQFQRLRTEADANNIFYATESPHLNRTLDGWGEAEFLEGDDGKAFVPAIVKQGEPGRVIPFCLMLTYRGNGPYDDALKAYHAVYPFIKDRIAPLIVLTTVRDKDADHPEYFATEEALIAAGIPITILFDVKSFWQDRVLAGAPENLVTDDKLKILWHDDLNDDFAYWDMLSHVQRN